MKTPRLTKSLGEARKVDLTHPLSPRTPPWPGNTPFSLSKTADYDVEGYFCSFDFQLAEHTGTHVDAPIHVVPGGLSLEQLDLDATIGPAVVLDVEKEARRDRDYSVGPDALARWEMMHGRLPTGAVVLINTGWYRFFCDPATYQGLDAYGVPHFPNVSPRLAEDLVERGVKIVGIDTLSPDAGATPYPRVHNIFLGNSVLIIENVANLRAVPPVGAVAIILPMKIEGGTGGPARVVALIEE